MNTNTRVCIKFLVCWICIYHDIMLCYMYALEKQQLASNDNFRQVTAGNGNNR